MGRRTAEGEAWHGGAPVVPGKGFRAGEDQCRVGKVVGYSICAVEGWGGGSAER